MPTETATAYRRQAAGVDSFLVINLVPIRLPACEIKVSYLPYESKDNLSALREKHFDSYVFRRQDDGRVACVRLDGKEPELGSDPTPTLLTDALSISAMLVRHALVNDYLARGCEVTDYRPIEVISASGRQNLLSTVISQGVLVPDWISVRQLAEMDLRIIWTTIRPFIGLAVNLRIRKRITLSCSELLKVGVDLSNLFVVSCGKSNDQ